jgi:hypothetical protein
LCQRFLDLAPLSLYRVGSVLHITQVLGGRILSIANWHDNEMAYAVRLAGMAVAIAG